ncbi:carboxypeptidase regulatory-like domain-containing protein [bacterium]|nr:carboxypeptidase regulatory-like domain-containing protein [candidate division CSSED10-310 bacterium]
MKKGTGVILALLFIAFGAAGSVRAAIIAGTVTDELTGMPINGLELDLYNSSWSFLEYYPVTDNEGVYIIDDLPPGEYYLKADPHYPQHYRQEYWRDAYTRQSASRLLLTTGDTLEGIDFALAPGGYFGGTVKASATGLPLENIDIQVYDASWQEADEGGMTDALGRYYVGGLAAGSYYIKANPVYPQPYVDQYWDGAKGPNGAVPAVLTIPGDSLAVNFELVAGGYITGTVRDGFTQAPVSDFLVKGYNSTWDKMRIQDHTNGSGFYVLGAWEAGLYYIKADAVYPDPYLDEYYGGAYEEIGAEPVTVTPPTNAAGIDLYLDPGSYIVGTVRSATNSQPLPMVEVVLYDQNWGELEQSDISDAAGGYVLGSLPAGGYFVAAPRNDTFYYRQYWLNAGAPQSATMLEVTPPQNRYSIDFLLESKGEDLMIGFDMPATIFQPNDTFFLDAVVINNSQPYTALPLFVLLGVLDQYYFWPSWSLYAPPEYMTIDFRRQSVTMGQQVFTIIDPFTWPVVDHSLSGLIFYGAFLNETFDQVIGGIGYIEWGYAP